LLKNEGEGKCKYPLEMAAINYVQKLDVNQKLVSYKGAKDMDARHPQFSSQNISASVYQVQFVTNPGKEIL
jgi:hypothetical protein